MKKIKHLEIKTEYKIFIPKFEPTLSSLIISFTLSSDVVQTLDSGNIKLEPASVGSGLNSMVAPIS